MSLFELERNAAFDELLARLERSSNPTVRKRSAEILGSLEGEAGGAQYSRSKIIDSLVEAAITDEDKSVRAAAVDAIDQYGQPALEELIGELQDDDFDGGAAWKKAEMLAESLNDSVPELRMAAATGLGRLGETNAVPALVETLEDPDPRVRKQAARACGRLESVESVPHLSPLLRQDHHEVRVEAAYALANIGSDNALRELSSVVDAEDESLRRIVVDALSRLGSVEAVEILVGALQDDSDTVRRTAMFSLVQLLSEAPAEASHTVRQKMVGELERANASESVDPLIEILDESTETAQRRNAAWLLGRVADDTHTAPAREALIDTLSDDNEMTSKFAATSLTLLDDEDLEERLLEFVTDDTNDEGARARALFVLGKIGGKTARQELTAFTDRTENERLRKHGFSALSKLGGIGAPGDKFA
ncbi:HEAT repeat domain-containing protein [Halobacteria archaeon AArc-dxtr1]|nr:HEAT repeat domain-containing protein [Halobacteria archaeon AArc-dxtr1]